MSPKKQSLASSYVLPAASSHRMNGSADAAGPLASVTSSGVPIARQCRDDVSECSKQHPLRWLLKLTACRWASSPGGWKRRVSAFQPVAARCAGAGIDLLSTAAAGGSWRLPDSLERGSKLVL